MARSDASDIREIRNYAGQVQRIASALSEDKDFAKRLIDAVHGGSSAGRISTVDGAESGTAGGTRSGAATPRAKAKAAAQTKTKTITVTVGIGPFSISVTVKKESK